MTNGKVLSWTQACRVTQGAPLNAVQFNILVISEEYINTSLIAFTNDTTIGSVATTRKGQRCMMTIGQTVNITSPASTPVPEGSFSLCGKGREVRNVASRNLLQQNSAQEMME